MGKGHTSATAGNDPCNKAGHLSRTVCSTQPAQAARDEVAPGPPRWQRLVNVVFPGARRLQRPTCPQQGEWCGGGSAGQTQRLRARGQQQLCSKAQGKTATHASGPRPVRVRFFEFYRAARVRSASAAVSPRGVSQTYLARAGPGSCSLESALQGNAGISLWLRGGDRRAIASQNVG
eukprot:gene9643-biopygen12245